MTHPSFNQLNQVSALLSYPYYHIMLTAILRFLQDNSTNLLRYIVRVYCREHDQNAGKNEAQLRLPLPASMQQAATISLTELDGQLNQLKHQLQTHKKKVRIPQTFPLRNDVERCFSHYLNTSECCDIVRQNSYEILLTFYIKLYYDLCGFRVRKMYANILRLSTHEFTNCVDVSIATVISTSIDILY